MWRFVVLIERGGAPVLRAAAGRRLRRASVDAAAVCAWPRLHVWHMHRVQHPPGGAGHIDHRACFRETFHIMSSANGSLGARSCVERLLSWAWTPQVLLEMTWVRLAHSDLLVRLRTIQMSRGGWQRQYMWPCGAGLRGQPRTRTRREAASSKKINATRMLSVF